MTTVHTSSIQSLPLLARGKVRDNYAVGDDRILMVASDRLSAFDVIMGEPIPGKGVILTQMALWWFDRLGHLCPNHHSAIRVRISPLPGMGSPMITSKADRRSLATIRMRSLPTA